MEIMYLLIPLSLVLLVVAVAAFFWAVRSGQFENLDSAGLDILEPEEKPAEAAEEEPTP